MSLGAIKERGVTAEDKQPTRLEMSVAISAIYFLNLRSDVLINYLYHDDVRGNMVDAFRMHIMQTKELSTSYCIFQILFRCGIR
ncbi:unnamed protein product, partial [Vitis vinifera]